MAKDDESQQLRAVSHAPLIEWMRRSIGKQLSPVKKNAASLLVVLIDRMGSGTKILIGNIGERLHEFCLIRYLLVDHGGAACRIGHPPLPKVVHA